MGIIWCIITWYVYTVSVYSFMKNWNHNTSPRFSLTYQVKVGHLSLKKKNLKSCIIFDKIVFGEVLLKKCKPLHSLNGKRYMYVASKNHRSQDFSSLFLVKTWVLNKHNMYLLHTVSFLLKEINWFILKGTQINWHVAKKATLILKLVLQNVVRLDQWFHDQQKCQPTKLKKYRLSVHY